MSITTEQNVTAKLQGLKARAERGKTERTRAETTLEQVAKQTEQLLKECAELGIDPDKLETEIAECGEKMQACIDKAEQLLEGVA